ncbi:MAG: class I SAM-dependent methyltransferase [Spirulina sp. SIO3F2]|nr:class I SAM-dependent methyltransferase [Spirulina sp. SIO3F2]
MTIQTIALADCQVKLQHNPQVWSPFSATEILQVLKAQGYLDNLQHSHVLDFGTGSGILGIALGLAGAASITLSDYCEIAVAIAAQNAKHNGLEQIEVIHSDRFTQVQRQDYDLILCNPPVQPWLYTDLTDQSHRQRVEAWNEAGADGRLVLDSLLLEAMNHLKVGGRLITATSSRHGYAKTQHLLDVYWGQWREIYAVEQPIVPDYHGPYLKSWQAMQAQDLDLRVYQKDEQGRPFAFYHQAGVPELITLENETPTRWQQGNTGWQTITIDGQNTKTLTEVDLNRLLQAQQESCWYYMYYIVEAIKT